MKQTNKKYTVLSILFIFVTLVSISSCKKTYSCSADKSWVTSPSMPTEVKKSAPHGKSNFCDFYQFSWQSFLYLTSPALSSTTRRNYQVVDKYPILEVSNDRSHPVNSCDESISENVLFIRTQKSIAHDSDFTLPKIIGQAGDDAVIYDQNKNVVYYEVQFSRNLCNVGKIQSQKNFPSGTTEIKTSWKVLTSGEEKDFFTINANIDGAKGEQTLGLIGFHLAVATKDHPEFVWATFEHKKNVPDCTNPQTTPASGWPFTSERCALALRAGNNPLDIIQCKFNIAEAGKKLTGTPTEICREYAHGTDVNDPNATENLDDIKDINKQLVGENGYLTDMDSSNPMAVFKNYFIVGALWVSNIQKPSSIKNQRGSLRLANTVSETTYQDVDLKAGFVSNCFGCHHYKVPSSNTLPSSRLSHIFDDIIKGVCTSPTDVNAGPIGNNDDAQTKCPTTCASKGGWNGQWKTTKPGVMSVCGCCAK